ncbi:MAG: hypothetical protein LIO78_01190, partial [Clostridiales bacterium]|nr:hypothetical protein [Clostridiales bacterium]
CLNVKLALKISRFINNIFLIRSQLAGRSVFADGGTNSRKNLDKSRRNPVLSLTDTFAAVKGKREDF